MIVEDADRLTESAANALLKVVEEPPSRTVFLLCAPSVDPEDIAVTQSTLTTLSGQARLRLRPCWGMHDTAFVAGLPLGIVLPERMALPAFMREGL